MEKIYIILHDNGYDAIDHPGDYYYSSGEEAEAECLKLNIANYGINKKYHSYFTHELILKNNQ